jgi:hypothetical protein
MDAAELTQLISALGGGAVILATGRAVFKWITGAAGRERVRNTSLLQQKKQAEAMADEEAAKRRMIQEYAARLRRQLIEADIEPEPEPDEMKEPPTRHHRGSKEGTTHDTE